MKTKRLLMSVLILALIIFGFVLFSVKEKQKTVLAAQTSAEQTSYSEVAQYLDKGGSLYLYLSTEKWLDGLSGQIAKWKDIFAGMPMGTGDRENLDKVIALVSRVVKDSGVESVSGFGLSSIAVDKDFYRTRMVLHHYKGKGAGFGWTMFGRAPHALNGLDMAPSTTALAVFSDFDAAQLWSVIQDETKHSGFPDADKGLDQFVKQFKRSSGLDWDKLLNSFGGEYGVILTLDDSKMVQLPLPTAEPFEIPDPGLLIVAKANDETLFNQLEKQLKQTRLQLLSVNKDHLKMRSVEVPVPLPITLRPSIAMADGYLYIASSDTLIEDALAVKAGLKPGLKSTDEFKHVAKDMPTQGNRYTYISQRFGQTYLKIQQQVMAMKGTQDPGVAKLMHELMNPDNAKYMFYVGATTDEGWVGIGNGNQNGAIVAAAVPVAVIAVGTAMVLPAVAAAKRRAAQINAMHSNHP